MELETLKVFWRDDSQRVASLIGLGGGGKTALASVFLDWLRREADPDVDGLFVWSFYVDQDPGRFIEETFRYFSQGRSSNATGLNALSRLADLLREGGRHLIVLDGLERIQCEENDRRGDFGELTDPLLRHIVKYLVQGMGQTKCLITSRFPMADISSWRDSAYRSIAVEQLGSQGARELMRERGVVGTNQAIDRVIADYGTHPLTVDHLATYLVRFCDGDPQWAPVLPPPSAESHSRQESKLARVLQAYEESLAQHESAFLSMMCVFRFGATVELISSLIEKNQGRGMPRALAKSRKEDLETLATRLCDLNLIQRESETLLTVHPAVRDFFYQRLEQPQKLHAVVAMAFDDQLDITRARKLEELMVVWAELDRTYDIFILHVEDRNEHEKEMVREILASRRQLEKQLDKQIRHYLAKYGDREDPSLVDLFLQCRENIKMGERPILPDEEDIHITLHARPGRNEFPIDSKTLDMLEELIFHTIEAGQPQVAYDLYEHRMGGRNNLAKRLGQFDRGLRIMLAFHPCPNMHDLAWYYRGVGDIERARQVMDETERIWTGTIHCLQGNLKQANTGRYFGNTKDVASLLMGTFDRPFRPPLFGWGEVIVDADYFLLKGDYDTAFQVADEQLSEFKGDGWTRHMPEAIRCRMVMAEAECRRGRPRKAATQLSKAEPWIFSSGAVEFLCQYHLTNGRILMALDCPQQARTKLLEGLHLARSCGFSLYHIDFANEIGSWLLGQLRLDEAEDAATAALKGRRSVRNQSDAYIAFDCEEPRLAGAEDVGCSYAWGRARSHSLLGDIHAERRQWRTACQHLSICQTIESRIDHPDLNRTRKRLEYAKRQANSGD